jgi:hypothetical protein
MDVGTALYERARAIGAASLAVVGTGKNAGKTVAAGAVVAALQRAGVPFGICSIGRDGETADVLDAAPKPRIALPRGATFATAAALLPRSPAVEILERTGEQSALGPVALARVRTAANVELAGPPTAAGLRRVVAALAASGCAFVVIDGAIDRLAALRDAEDAIVAAVGATAATPEHAVDDVAALVGRLRLRLRDPALDAIHVEGALTAGAAAAFVRAGERRQIVVRDGTHVAFGGRAFLTLAAQLELRCAHELRPIACTIASIGAQRSFEPRAFLRAVAARTGLPAYDVYARAGAA